MALEQIERKTEKENKVFLSATVNPGIKESIDEVKGILSRSQYVQQAIVERIAKDRTSKHDDGNG
jgi:hypothetical protein